MRIEIIPARTCVQWLRLGFQTFWRQPLAFVALASLLTTIHMLLSRIPFVGMLLSTALLPFETLLVMVAAAQAFAGRTSTQALLIHTFRTVGKHLRALLTLSAVQVAVLLLLLGLMSAVNDGSFAYRYLHNPQDWVNASPSEQMPLHILNSMMLPLEALFGFAPALVHWHRVPVIPATFFSAAAYLRNWRAFVLLGLIEGSIIAAILMVLSLSTGFTPAAANVTRMIFVNSVCMVPIVIMGIAAVFSFRDCLSSPHAPPASAMQA